MKQNFVLLAFLFLLLMGCQPAPHNFPEPSSVPSPSPDYGALPGRWVVLQVAGDECRYSVVKAHRNLAPDALRPSEVLVRPCREVGKVIMVDSTMLVHGLCPSPSVEGDLCWQAVSWPGGKDWRETPLRSPLLLFRQQVLFPCGFDVLRWCQWQPGASEPTRVYAPIQAPPQVDPNMLMPLAWSLPWLLMGEEAPCDTGAGGKVWSVFQKYWLINLVTGLPTPWKVWQAIDAAPRCLREGETLDGYVWIDLMGWNPARSDELAFAVRRFPNEYYEQPLDLYLFRTEIYIWHANGAFDKVGAFSHLSCGLWAPDGSGWLCQRLNAEGNIESHVFITRQGELVAQWPYLEEMIILQWLP